MIERMWAVDIEGNGKTPPEIVEIAIVELRGLERTGLRRNWRLRPPSGISPMASRIHGIWERDVADAPDLEDIADDILVWLEGAPIVGHNVRVELEVLGRALEEWSPTSAYDTLKLARMMLPDAPMHGLEALGAQLGLDAQAASETGSTAHSALYDATLAAILLKYLLQPLPADEQRRRLAAIDLLAPPKPGAVDLTRPFKIAVAGTHSTGKSNFVEALLSELRQAGFASEGVHDSAADARALGFPILADHSFESTAWLMSQAIRLETEASLRSKVIVIDRPVPDALGYMRAALRYQSRTLTSGRLQRLEEICRTWVAEYDLIFVTVLDEQVPIGPGRPADEAFRRLAAKCVAEVFEEMAPHAIPLRHGAADTAVATCMAAVLRHAAG